MIVFKVLKYFVILLVSLALCYCGLVLLGKKYVSDSFNYGITFSKTEAENYDLNWKEAYLASLYELNVKNIRIPVYWQEVESNKDEYDFSDYDWQVQEAAKKDAQVILVVGRRVPRWPECHIPVWAKNMEETEQQKEILNEIEAIVNHFKIYDNVWAWQVENEAFLHSFGECPELDADFLDKEVSLVHSLDDRPIIMTSSGELSIWVDAAKKGDIFGTSIYRVVYTRYFGELRYPIPPSFFLAKAGLVRLFSNIKKIITIEAQAEPWGDKSVKSMTTEEQNRLMGIDQFRDNIEYFKKVGFGDIYLWGAEWWYWRKKSGDNSLWEEAKKVFNNN